MAIIAASAAPTKMRRVTARRYPVRTRRGLGYIVMKDAVGANYYVDDSFDIANAPQGFTRNSVLDSPGAAIPTACPTGYNASFGAGGALVCTPQTVQSGAASSPAATTPPPADTSAPASSLSSLLSGFSFSSIPTWGWIAIGVGGVFLFLKSR
jgi:hypothetical protein